MISDRKLSEMNIKEANANLSDDEFNRWKLVKEQELYKQHEKNQQVISNRNEKAIDTLIKSGKKELVMTVDLFGGSYDFLVNLNQEQRQIFNKLRQKKVDSEKQDIPLDEMEGISELIVEFLAGISLDFNQSDFTKLLDELGFVGLYEIFVKVMSEFKDNLRENEELIRKFRKG